MDDKYAERRAYIVVDDGETVPMIVGTITGKLDDDGVFDKRKSELLDATLRHPHVYVTEITVDVPF